MKPFSWTCRYCGHSTSITSPVFSEGHSFVNVENHQFDGNLVLIHTAIGCPNPSCGQVSLAVRLSENKNPNSWNYALDEGTTHKQWPLMPRSTAKPLPDYIPKAIRSDYEEACLIVRDSPKASAAMARRCLQGIVRDFWEIPSNKRGNLGAEINYIKDRLSVEVYESIIAVREIGDIGAHMDKDVNVIIDVAPEEASILLELIEMLIEDWYIEKHKRKERSNRLTTMVADKRTDRKALRQAPKEQEAN